MTSESGSTAQHPPRTCVLHWGKLGAGPLITSRLAEGFAALGAETFASVAAEADAHPRLDRSRIHSVRTFWGVKQMVTRSLLLPVTLMRARRFLQRNRIELVVTTMVSLWQSLGIFLIVPRGVTLYATIHDPVEHIGERSLIATVLRKFEIARADTVITYSEASREALEHDLRGRTRVIAVPHGVESKEGVVARSAPTGVLTVGFFGRLNKYKGLDVLAEGIRIARSRGLQVRGLVIGDGDVDPDLVEGSRDLIEWQVGWVDSDQVDDVLTRFDVVALPYTEATQSGVLPLAAAAGIPAIVSPLPGLLEQAEFYGNAIPMQAMSAGALADAIGDLVDAPRRYEQLSAAGVAGAQASSWSAVSEMILTDFGSPSGRRRAH